MRRRIRDYANSKAIRAVIPLRFSHSPLAAVRKVAVVGARMKSSTLGKGLNRPTELAEEAVPQVANGSYPVCQLAASTRRRKNEKSRG